MTTRRELLQGAGAIAAAAVLPSPVLSAQAGAPIAVTAVEMPKQVAWLAGTEDYGYRVVFGHDETDAAIEYTNEAGHGYCEQSDGFDPCDDGDCEDCGFMRSIEAERKPSMDRFLGREDDITNADLHRIGVGVPCKWCEDQRAYSYHDEYPAAGETRVIGGIVFCDECEEVLNRMLDDEYGAQEEGE